MNTVSERKTHALNKVLDGFCDMMGRGGKVRAVDNKAVKEFVSFMSSNTTEAFNYGRVKMIPADGMAVPEYKDKNGKVVNDEKLDSIMNVEYDPADGTPRVYWWYRKKGGSDWGNGQLRIETFATAPVSVAMKNKPRVIFDLNLRFYDRRTIRKMMANFVVWISPVGKKLDICFSDRCVFNAQYHSSDLLSYLDFVAVEDVRNDLKDEFEDVLVEYPEDIEELGMFSSDEGYEVLKRKMKCDPPNYYFKVRDVKNLMMELAK